MSVAKTTTAPALVDTFYLQSGISLQENKATGKIIARGEFARVGHPTSNKRIYTKEVYEREIKRLTTDMEARRLYGQVDHPEDGKPRLRDASHIITGLKIESDGRVVGEAELLPTEHGKHLATLLKSGCSVGVSSRGFGSTQPNEEGFEVVQEDFRLITFDFVAEPADQTAIPEFFSESREADRMAEKMSVEDFRKKCPDLVKQIEMDAVQIAGNAFEEDLDKRAAAIREEERSKSRAELKDDFALKLVKKLEEKTAAIRASVKSEMLSDPDIAGAKSTLETIKNAIRPYVLGEDAEAVVAERQAKVTNLESRLSDHELKIQKLESDLDEATKLARKFGFSYFVEKTITDHPAKDAIRSRLGNVSDFDSREDLKTRLDNIIEQIEAEEVARAKDEDDAVREAAEREQELRDSLQRAADEARDKIQKESDEKTEAVRSSVKAKQSEIEGILVQMKGKVEELEAKHEQQEVTIARQQSALEEALEVAKHLGLQAYAQEKIGVSPKSSRLRRAVKAAKPSSREEVDRILSEASEVSTRDDDEFERIRAKIGRGRSTLTEDERLEEERQTDQDNVMTDLAGFDQGQLRRLAGLDNGV